MKEPDKSCWKCAAWGAAQRGARSGGKDFLECSLLNFQSFFFTEPMSSVIFFALRGPTWCQCNINLNRNWRLKWQFFEVQKGHFSGRTAVRDTKRYSPSYWEWEEKYLMNSIIFIGDQKNISNRCICPWPNDRTACNLSRDFNFSYYRSSNGEEFHSLGENARQPVRIPPRATSVWPRSHMPGMCESPIKNGLSKNPLEGVAVSVLTNSKQSAATEKSSVSNHISIT